MARSFRKSIETTLNEGYTAQDRRNLMIIFPAAEKMGKMKEVNNLVQQLRNGEDIDSNGLDNLARHLKIEKTVPTLEQIKTTEKPTTTSTPNNGDAETTMAELRKRWEALKAEEVELEKKIKHERKLIKKHIRISREAMAQRSGKRGEISGVESEMETAIPGRLAQFQSEIAQKTSGANWKKANERFKKMSWGNKQWKTLKTNIETALSNKYEIDWPEAIKAIRKFLFKAMSTGNADDTLEKLNWFIDVGAKARAINKSFFNTNQGWKIVSAITAALDFEDEKEDEIFEKIRKKWQM